MSQQATGIIIHGIGTPRRALEPGEQPYWISRDQFLGLLDRIIGLPDPQAVRITFDDGNLSDHDIALPALTARGLRAEFFVLTGRIGQAGSLDASHILELQQAGMGIGSHGVDHVDWARADVATLKRELSASRERLEEICARPITEAAIPFGSYNGRVIRALRMAGYDRVWSSDRGRFREGAFLCPRASVQGQMQDDDFSALVSGHLGPVARLRRAAMMTLKRL